MNNPFKIEIEEDFEYGPTVKIYGIEFEDFLTEVLEVEYHIKPGFGYTLYYLGNSVSLVDAIQKV